MPRRHPLLHFLVLGGVLWAGDWAWQDYRFRQVDYPQPQTIERLAADWAQRHGRVADQSVREQLIRREIDERILFREALRLGLHRGDPVVLRRLYQDVAFLGLQVPQEQRIQTALDLELHAGDAVIRRRLLERMRTIGRGPAPAIDEAALQAQRAADPQRWQTPERLSFRHIFVRNGPGAKARIRALRPHPGPLPQAGEGDTLSPPGDPFLLGDSFQAMSQQDIAQRLGPAFAAALWAAMPGQGGWSPPLRSAYGWHLVQVTRHHAPQPRPFGEVRERLAAEMRREQQAQRLRDWIAALRQRYRVRR